MIFEQSWPELDSDWESASAKRKLKQPIERTKIKELKSKNDANIDAKEE
jgi:hypothetical protein